MKKSTTALRLKKNTISNLQAQRLMGGATNDVNCSIKQSCIPFCVTVERSFCAPCLTREDCSGNSFCYCVN
jgi:hypothetical protein